MTKKSESLRIGFPTNSRIAEDCTPLKDALELEGRQGLLKSRFIQDAIFRTARVRDMARFLKQGVYKLGILGDDTALDEDLEAPGGLTAWCILSANRIGGFSVGKPTSLSFFCKQEDEKRIRFADRRGLVITQYPRLAKKAIFDRIQMKNIEIRGNFDGQIEAIVRNGDIPGVIGGIDIVRTGDTLRSFDLVEVERLFSSRPALWKTPRISSDNTKLEDTISAIAERLVSFLAEEMPPGCMAP